MTVKSSSAQLITAFLLGFTNYLESACISGWYLPLETARCRTFVTFVMFMVIGMSGGW